MTELGVFEPVNGELVLAVRQVLTAKHTEPKHLLRREIRMKFGMKISAGRLSQIVNILLLHEVIYDDTLSSTRTGHCLFEAVGDSTSGQIIRRHFDADAVTDQNADVIFAHLA